MCVFNVVLCLRNKYLNLSPRESLSTAVGRDGKLGVCAHVRQNPKHDPSACDPCPARNLLRACPLCPGVGRWRLLCFRVAVLLSQLLLLQKTPDMHRVEQRPLYVA